MIEGKGLGNKKVNRVNISLSNKYNGKLNKLATSCRLKPTSLACLLVERCLDDPALIEELQNEYGVHLAYRIIPVKHFNSKDVSYILNGERDVF